MKYCRDFLPGAVALVAICGCIAVLVGMMQFSSGSAAAPQQICFVIDAGHGGIDGGATSCTGALESNINLEISLRLRDVMHLLGLKTEMIRTEDISVYTQGQTIAAKKVSDLKERVRIVNATNGAVLLSIHQNYYTQSKYSGAQVFYQNEDSKALALNMQNALRNLGSERKIKKSKGIYLMEHIKKPGVLIECGFLSNPAEEARLRSHNYQKKLCCVIATVCTYYETGLDRV